MSVAGRAVLQYNIPQFYISTPAIIWIPSGVRETDVQTTNLPRPELCIRQTPYIIFILLFLLYSTEFGRAKGPVFCAVLQCYY